MEPETPTQQPLYAAEEAPPFEDPFSSQEEDTSQGQRLSYE